MTRTAAYRNTTKSDDGSGYFFQYWTRDATSSPLLYEWEDPGSGGIGNTVYTYDDFGRFESEISESDYGSSTFKGVDYSYNEPGLLAEESAWSDGEAEPTITTHTYDSAGREIEELVDVTSVGWGPYRSTWVYDDAGTLLIWECDWYDDGYVDQWHYYSFDTVPCQAPPATLTTNGTASPDLIASPPKSAPVGPFQPGGIILSPRPSFLAPTPPIR